MATLEHSEALALGSVLGGRFEILGHAGRGGMGTVFRALDRQTCAVVAVKVTSERAASAHSTERFEREARMLAGSSHPGIVRYVAHGQTPTGRLFIAMEWLDGEDLGQRLARGPLGIHDALHVVRAAADALADLHGRGIVHRDVKPSNLFLRVDRLARATLLDFGIARATTGRARLTDTGTVLGTPDYMSPEQAAGQNDVGPAADVFSLGCVLFDCLVGEPPFASEHVAAVLAKILFQEAPSVRARRPGVPRAVEAALERMLAKDPALRPTDAAALLTVLPRAEDVAEQETSAGSGAAAKPTWSLADVELRYISVVIATRRDRGPPQTTIDPDDLASANAERSALDQHLSRLGARAAWLADGSIVATLARAGSATDQAIQAARCALVLHERWPSAEIGLATGRGVVHERLPVGDAIDRAARLVRATTGPATGVVLVDEVSAGLLDARFSLERGDGAFVLTGEHAATDEARRLLGKPTPCVGREQELTTLGAVISTCTDESVARAVLVTAPPGMGKSRLRREFLRRLLAGHDVASAPLVLSGRAEPMNAGSPYDLLARAIRAECGAAQSEALPAGQAKLRARIARHVPPADVERVTAFLAELCGMPVADDARPALRAARRDPRIMSDQVSLAFVDLMRAECRARPLLLILEDLHWGDVLTVKLVDLALRELSDRPWMVLAFARPEVTDLFPGLWSGHVQEIRLGGLSKKASERLVVEVLGRDVPQEVVRRVVEQAAGNALHLEELIRAVGEGKGDQLPETILAMLEARLYRLTPESRRVLRAASVFGDTFSRGGVVALSGVSASEADVLLDALVGDEVIKRRPEGRFAGDQDYGFRHALLHHVAYATLADQDRKLGHCGAGAFLERSGERDPMVIAEHYFRGGELERAGPLYARAAEQALLGNDLRGALARAERGMSCGTSGEALGVLAGLAASAHFWRDEWAPGYEAAKVALARLPRGSWRWCKTIAHQFVFTSMGLAKHEEFGELVRLFSRTEPTQDARTAFVEATSWLVTMFSLLGRRAETLGFLALLDRVCSASGGDDVIAEAWKEHARMFHARMLGDDPWATLGHAERSSAAYRAVSDHRNLAFIDGYRGMAQAELGLLDEGEATLRASLAVGERLREVLMTTNSRLYLALLLSRTADRSSVGAGLATEILGRNQLADGVARGVLAKALLDEGDLPGAEAEARKACDLLAMMPALRLGPLAILLRVLVAGDRGAEARELGDGGLSSMDGAGGGYNEVAFRVAAAEARLAAGDAVGARNAAREALSRVELRAARIPDTATRAAFLCRVSENLRARELAEDG